MSLENLKLSVLDLVPVREGGTVSEALAEAAALAQTAEDLGYHRFWVAEHHGMEGIAGAAVSVVLAHIGNATSRIRLGDHQRVVVGQHDPARAQPDRGGIVAHMGKRDRHGRAGDPFHAVVFGHPVALVTAALGHLREQRRLGERLAYRSALDHGHEIEDGQFHDGFFSGCVAPEEGLAEGVAPDVGAGPSCSR